MSEQSRLHQFGKELHEDSHEIEQHHERLKELHESSAEKAGRNTHHEKEIARHEEHEHATSQTEHAPQQAEQAPPPVPTTKADKTHSFNTIMHHARQNMSKPERTFSKLIHAPLVEKTSEALGKTVVRPSGIVRAPIDAFLCLLSIYSIAKFSVFELSGSEIPLLLSTGFILGLFVEWAFKSARSILFSKRA